MSLEEKNSIYGLPRTNAYQKIKKENLSHVREGSTGRKIYKFEPNIIRSTEGGGQGGLPTPTTGAFSNAFSNAFNL